MSLQLQNLVKPFSCMTPDEQLALVRNVRFNRYKVQPSKVKTAKVKTERKVATKKKASVKGLLKGMTREAQIELLKSIQ